jgi:Protein of unknown function (DUF3445)
LLPTYNPQAAPLRVEPDAALKEPYHLHALVLTFPSVFDPAKKLCLPLAGKSANSRGSDQLAIHSPVPGYAAKLEKSTGRFFVTLPYGMIIWRSNWSISMDGKLSKVGDHIDVRNEGGDDVRRERSPEKLK